MAIRVPVGPTVDPSTRPLSPSTPEGVFGIGGDVLGAVGKTAQQTSEMFAQHAEKMAAIDNKIDADTHDLQFQQRVSEFTNKYVAENQGERAEPNLAQAFKDIENIRNETGAGLMSPAARDLYNSQTRIGALQATQGLARFASSEGFRVRNEKIDAQVANTVRGLTVDNIAEGAARIGEIGALKAALNGWSEDQAKAWVADKVGDAAYSIGAGLAPSDPAAAQAFRDKYGATMSPPQRTALDAQIKASHDNFAVMSTVDAAVAANSTGDSVEGRRAAIAGIESAGKGDYRAVGPKTRTGDHAYGKYQVMGANIGPWTKEVLGRALTPQQFLADPAAQDRVFDAKFGQFAQQYGSAAEAASVWFTGRTQAQGGATAKDVNGMTGAEYVRRFSAGLGGTKSVAENLTDTLPAQLAQFDKIPDPVLREKVVTEYTSRVERARRIESAVSGEAKDRLFAAGAQAGITDLASLGKAYPGALEDIAKLSGQAQAQLMKQLTTAGNQDTPTRTNNYLMIRGMLLNPATATQWVSQDLTGYDLTASKELELRKMQQGALYRKQQHAVQQANVARVLGMEPVKQALAARPDMAPDSHEYNYFTGRLSVELDEWNAAHPNQKIGETDAAKLVAQTLSSVKPARTYWDFGLFRTPGKMGGTITVPTKVPEDQAARIREVYSAAYGYELSDWEVGQKYQEILNRQEAARGGR